MELNVKKIVLLCLCVAMALMILLGMLFNVVQLSNKGDVADHENGYTLLTFSSDFILSSSYDWGAVVCGVVNLLILLSGVAALVMAIYTLVNFNKPPKFNLVIIVLAGVTSTMYMIEGAVFASIVKSTYNPIFSDYIHTVSFVPMILQAFLVVAYVLCNIFIPEKSAKNASSSANAPAATNEVQQTANKVTILKQYKELLDSGVITQEEFDEQKKKWL